MIDAFDRNLPARGGRPRLSFGFAACLNAIGTGLVERQRQRRIRKRAAFSALDFTLAWHMLLRYPGLSLVSVLGMSVGIAIAAGGFTIVSMVMGTRLPLPEGEVARRRREIGIREALGANRNRILVGIFSRVLAQLGAGGVLGLIAAVGLEQILEGDMMRNYRAMLLPLVVLLMMTIGVIAAIGPARQGLRIQPIEALRDE